MRNALAVGAAAIALTGCTSFQGQPYSVFPFEDTLNPVRENYKPVTVVTDYYGLSSKDEKRAYRDKVLSLYIIAIDARYDQFLRNISMQNKGGNSAVDIAALGLSGAVPLFNGTGVKDALGAGSTFLSGSQGKVNSRVFYEATLPAIINVMETERKKVLAEILRKKKADRSSDAIVYDMSEALMDLARYENAVSIDKAVSILNEKAAEGLGTAESNLEQAGAAQVEAAPAGGEGADAPPEAETNDTPEAAETTDVAEGGETADDTT